MAELVVQNLYRQYGAVVAISDVNFTIGEGEFLTLLGPSGCGKSTTLAAIAGLETPTSGMIRAGSTVFFDSSTGQHLPTEKRNCGLVFQSYALWPHLTVAQNLAFPLKLRKVSKADQARRIDEALGLVEMVPYKDRYPFQLSGGQQQRVALARTLVYEPSVLLLDEPLSNLDAKLRERARVWLDELRHRVRRTTLYVTHDQQEALVLSDRIAVMKEGKIVQLGTPRDIYERPADPFVADFIGTSSFLKGELKEVLGEGQAMFSFGEGTALRGIMSKPSAERMRPGARVLAALRPERLSILPPSAPTPSEPGTLLEAKTRSRAYLGARWQYELQVRDTVIKIETPDEIEGDRLPLWVPATSCLIFADA